MLMLSRIKTLCLCLLLTLPVSAHATNAAAELQALQSHAYRATTQMMMYIILERAPERKTSAAALLSAGDATIARIGDAALEDKWQSVRAILTKEPYYVGGVNTHAIFEMATLTTELAADIKTRMPADLSGHRKTLYEMTGLLQTMTTIYLRNNADPQGGSGFFGSSADVDLAELQQKFSSKLNGLIKTSPKLAKALAKTQTKWTFIGGRFADYNQQSAPYAIDFVAHQILDDLLALAAATP